ncbi:unnamed protein product [Sphagnum compactum]
MADRMRQREESSASTEPLPSAAASSPSSASLSSTIRKITTIEAFTEEDGDRVPYFPPNLKVFLEEPKSWDNLPKRSRLRFNHPLPDDDGCYHIESVIARAQVKIDGVFRLRFLVRWKGFEDVHNTWEPYAELEGTEALFRFENHERLCPVVRVFLIGGVDWVLWRYPDFKDDVQKLELNFLAELGLAWGKEEMGSYYLSPKVIGRTQRNNELLEKFLKRNPEQRNKFAATETEVRKTITATSNKYEKSVFLAMGPLNRGSGADGRTIHTGLGCRRTAMVGLLSKWLLANRPDLEIVWKGVSSSSLSSSRRWRKSRKGSL